MQTNWLVLNIFNGALFIPTNQICISQLEEAIDNLLATSPNMTIQDQEKHKIVQARKFILFN